MDTLDRKAYKYEMQTLDFQGLEFVCSGEQLLSGAFRATVRYKAPPDNQILTLVLDSVEHPTAGQALEHAKQLAMRWTREQGGDGRGES